MSAGDPAASSFKKYVHPSGLGDKSVCNVTGEENSRESVRVEGKKMGGGYLI